MPPKTKPAEPTLRPYKFIVQAIGQLVDAHGNVIGETAIGDGPRPDGTPAPFICFGCDSLAKFASEFPEFLAKAAKADAQQTP